MDAFDLFPSFCWTSCQNSTVIGLLLRHKQRLRETAKKDNSAWEIGILGAIE